MLIFVYKCSPSIFQEHNQAKLTNIKCYCSPKYCSVLNCSIRQKSRSLSELSYAVNLTVMVDSVIVYKIVYLLLTLINLL